MFLVQKRESDEKAVQLQGEDRLSVWQPITRLACDFFGYRKCLSQNIGSHKNIKLSLIKLKA